VTGGQRAVAARAASVLLRYPDAELLAALPTVQAALAELAAEGAPDRAMAASGEPASAGVPLSPVAQLATLAGHLAAGEPRALAASYVETFDFRRRCCLYLTYYTHGDTRARGQALVGFAAAYRSAGYALPANELPDYLPAALELAATAGGPGWQLLHTHRVGVDLLSAALAREESAYRHALAAVQALLPPVRPGDRDAAAQLAAAGPPAELVGLQPFPTGGRR
jgi:nitrate reductase delta subunit